MSEEQSTLERTRCQLYGAYCEELSLYDESDCEYPADQDKKVAHKYMSDPDFEWIDIVANGEVVGFLIIGQDLDIHEDGLYICEAYVRADHRNQGLMTSKVHRVLESYDGEYIYLDIFQKNHSARCFWEKILTGWKYNKVNSFPFYGNSSLIEYTYRKLYP